METLEALRQELRDLEDRIRETRKRLPAHSVKPPVMMDLLELEDAWDAVQARIRDLTPSQKNGRP